MKQCSSCKEFKSSNAFYTNTSRCKLCDKKASIKYRENNSKGFKKSSHKRRLKHSYGLDYENYLNLLEKQNGVCAICEKDNKNWNMAVDHCHETGKIRGLLCNTCNRAIGLFKDDPALLNKAIKYLSVTH